MNYELRTKKGFTLTEMTVVVAAVALLTALSLPAVRSFFYSMASSSDTKALISASLASARAIAAKEQRYAGIRFQQDTYGHQYIIFIVHDFDKTGLDPGFRAVEGIQPIKLSDDIGVMYLRVRTDHRTIRQGAENTGERLLLSGDLDDTNPANLDADGKNMYITDTTSFSIVFSPSGKMLIHDVRVRNRNGFYQPDNSGSKFSMDDVFNSPVNIVNYHVGMFIQDDYAERGLGAEPSRNSLIIYDKLRFNKMNNVQRYNYLSSLEAIYINPYTGTIINGQ